MSTAAAAPDIRLLQGEDLPPGDFPVGGKQAFRVFFAPAVHDQIWKHASENLALEICGVLVGSWQRDAVGPYVTVSEFIRCDAAKSGFSEVTFTHESWTKINAEMDTRLSGFKIVGWYHSHPDFGIFLSDRDIFIHQHFFSGAGQIAHVVDPVRKIDGVFAWQQGKPVLRPHFWVGDRIFVTPERAAKDDVAQALQAEPVPRSLRAPEPRWAWLGTITTALMFACVLLLGFLSGQRTVAWERQRERQRELEGVVLYFAQQGILRPQLDEHLAKVGFDLKSVSGDVSMLAEKHLKLAGDEKSAVQEQWDEVRGRLAESGQDLARIRQLYSLTPEEQAVVNNVVRELIGLVERELRSQRRPHATDDKPPPSDETSSGDAKQKRGEKPESPRKKSTSSAPKPADESAPAGEKRKPSKD